MPAVCPAVVWALPLLLPPYSPRPNRRRSPHIHPPTQNTYSLILVSKPASISPYTHPTHSPYRLILRDLSSVDPLTYTPPTHNTYILFLVSQPASIFPHSPPPTHNTYSLFLVSQLVSISPHTFCLSSSPSLLTLCVGMEFAALFVCYLWREASVKRTLSVQCQPTVSAICDVIFLCDNGNDHCELLVVILCRDHLIQNAFHPPFYYHSWEMAKCIVVSHSYEIIAGNYL